MSENEEVIWSEKAGMADFKVYPIHWIFTAVTLGLYFLITYLTRFYTRYTLTNERLIKESGILKKERDEIELFRIKDTAVRAGLFQRFVGYGNIAIVSSDLTGTFVLENMPDAMKKREQIRSMSNKSREAKGIRTVISE
jgi:uncharacterized membrane protein YdbT with pleckstrin-like domain